MGATRGLSSSAVHVHHHPSRSRSRARRSRRPRSRLTIASPAQPGFTLHDHESGTAGVHDTPHGHEPGAVGVHPSPFTITSPAQPASTITLHDRDHTITNSVRTELAQDRDGSFCNQAAAHDSSHHHVFFGGGGTGTGSGWANDIGPVAARTLSGAASHRERAAAATTHAAGDATGCHKRCPEGVVSSKNAFEFLRIFLNDSGRTRAKPSI
jgi:hypothetical protein